MAITKKTIKKLEETVRLRFMQPVTRLSILQEIALQDRRAELLDELFENVSPEVIEDLMESQRKNAELMRMTTRCSTATLIS